MRFSKYSAVTKCKLSFYFPSLTTAQGPGGGEVSLSIFLGNKKLSVPLLLLPSSFDVVVHENDISPKTTCHRKRHVTENDISPKIAERKREHYTQVKIKTTIKMTLWRPKIK